MISVTAPIATVSETNQREHWAKQYRRRKSQRRTAYFLLSNHKPPLPPYIVTVTRISPRKLDGHDNLTSALKATVDGVADYLGMDDGDDRIEWRYGQERGKPKEQAVRIEIQEKRDG